MLNLPKMTSRAHACLEHKCAVVVENAQVQLSVEEELEIAVQVQLASEEELEIAVQVQLASEEELETAVQVHSLQGASQTLISAAL